MLYFNKRIEVLGKCLDFLVLDLVMFFWDYVVENWVCLYGFENILLCIGYWNREGY